VFVVFKEFNISGCNKLLFVPKSASVHLVLENLRPTATPKQQESAVRKLLKRNFGTYQSQINVKVDPALANENEEKSMVTSSFKEGY